MDRSRSLLLAATLILALAACAPTTGAVPGDAPTTPDGGAELADLERTAWEAWHLMQLGFLRTGVYSTNVLVDLPLPQGVRWTVSSFEEDTYALTFTAEGAAGGWHVDPAGVRPTS